MVRREGERWERGTKREEKVEGMESEKARDGVEGMDRRGEMRAFCTSRVDGRQDRIPSIGMRGKGG